jgi:hypothetical protein
MAGTTSSCDSSGKRSNAEMDRSKDNYSPDQKNPKQFICREEMMGKFMHLKDKDLENATKMIDDFSKMKAMNEKLGRLLSKSKIKWTEDNEVTKDDENDDEDEEDSKDESMNDANLQANSTALNENIQNKENSQTTEFLQDTAAPSTASQISNSKENNRYTYTVRIKFAEKKSYQPIQLMNEIKKNKGNCIMIENAFINTKNNQLYIFTNDKQCYEHLMEPWNAEAFGGGAEIFVGSLPRNEKDNANKYTKQTRYFLAIKNFDVDIDLENDDTFKQACERFGIISYRRILKTSTKQVLPLIRCEVKDLSASDFLLMNKFKYGFVYFNVTEWKFDDTRPLQCYRCLKFGHHQRQCNEHQQKCLICGGDHGHKDCSQQSKLKCINCEGQHAACSKSCPKSQEAIELKKRQNEPKISKKSPNEMTYSDAIQKNHRKIAVHEKETSTSQNEQIEKLINQLNDLQSKYNDLLKVVNSLSTNLIK